MINPFRHLVVYPALLHRVHRAWETDRGSGGAVSQELA